MSQDPNHSAVTPDDDAATQRASLARSRRRMIVIIALMLAAFAVVVVFRREMRARWWGYRLAHTEDVARRLGYLELLAADPGPAEPIARDLLAAPDASTRSFGVVLAARMEAAVAIPLLARAARDPDAAVRQGAVQALSYIHQPDAARALLPLADTDDPGLAMLATRGLVNTQEPIALEALMRIARTHPHAGVRAEAITSLQTADDVSAVPALIECLADHAVFAGETATEQAARESLSAVAPHLAAEPADAAAPRPSNCRRALTALEALTGAQIGECDPAPEATQALIERWRSR
jgi:HEAT repeat protein